jgi:RNA recognition motif-containing protein
MMAKIEDAHRVLTEMDGYEIDGRPIKCDRARRRGGYEKTPGQCTFLFLLFLKFCSR